MSKYSVGVDFGTLSARAILVDMENGNTVAEAQMEYAHQVMCDEPCWNKKVDRSSAFQNPQDYLDCLSYVVKSVISGVDAEDVLGIGIDFTSCTMLPVDEDGVPMCFKDEYADEPHAYVKLWKHHGAQREADFITEKAIENGEEWLSTYGGKVSSEWLLPKILETLNKAPKLFEDTSRFIEAADWLVWMITGEESHSSCMAGYKGLWNKKSGYPSREFLKKISPQFENIVGTKISEKVKPTGVKAGEINEYGSALTGLKSGTVVAVPIIDAHAALPAAGIVSDKKLMLIIGTSTCHIVMDKNMYNVPGICGSVEDGVIPGYVAYEAGQACVGDSFDWFVKNSVPGEYYEEAKKSSKNIFELLTEKAEKIKVEESRLVALDWWNGNRTPYADYDLSGVIVGLTLSTKPEEVYRAMIESTAFGTKRIVELYENNGVKIDEIYATGGISQKNSFLMQIYADVLGKKIVVPVSTQAGAKGSAILAACASGYYTSFDDAAKAMADKETLTYIPDETNVHSYLRLYEIYKELSRFFGEDNKELMKKLKK